MSFEGRTALVTGGASGIGEGIATALTGAGAAVGIFDIDGDAVDRAVDRLSAGPGAVVGLVGSVTSSGDAAAAVELLVRQLGAVDILVNCAGIILPATELTDTTDRDFDRVVEVNLKGQFIFCRASARVMREARYGRIVNIASRSWLGGSGIANYAASKAAIIGLSRSLAMELGRSGITVNCVSPALVDTPLFRGMPEEEQQADLEKAKRHPIPRLGSVEDIANAVLFFAAEASGYVTGQHLYVAGGADLLTSGST